MAHENNLDETNALQLENDALSNLTRKWMKPKMKRYFIECSTNLTHWFNQYSMKKQKSEINMLVYMRRRGALACRGLVGSGAEISALAKGTKWTSVAD